ncbi:p63 related protein [Ophiostoma piceae UAMH 11346]|uniref:p63 related protein n=1 Tax=Ophiostoma piceae (strain UAMH 11346) TaxID=1262450 RepID=S3CRB4_OPHP1|nr:p63 related protein [Ophiostoma piceae UAMH 11346]
MRATPTWDHNLGPLTTTATLPESCTANYEGYYNTIYRGQTCTSEKTERSRFQDDPSCWPDRSGYAVVEPTNPPLLGWGFYSPGLICPTGFVTACEQTGGGGSNNYFFQFPPASSETAYGCCPSGFVCSMNNDYLGQTCVSIATSTALKRYSCSFGELQPPGTLDVPFVTKVVATTGPSNDHTSKTYSMVTVFAPMIQIVRQKGDESLLPKHKLSAGAIAGIAICVSIVVLSLVAGAVYCFIVARRKGHGTENRKAFSALKAPTEMESLSAFKSRRASNSQSANKSPDVFEAPDEFESPTAIAAEMPAAQASPSPVYAFEKDGTPLRTRSPEGHQDQHYVQQFPGYQAIELQ